jgi:hypothetical protein
MTRMLDILMDYCHLRNFNFSRLDGSMSYSEREKNVRPMSYTKFCFVTLILIVEVIDKKDIQIYKNDQKPCGWMKKAFDMVLTVLRNLSVYTHVYLLAQFYNILFNHHCQTFLSHICDVASVCWLCPFSIPSS